MREENSYEIEQLSGLQNYLYNFIYKMTNDRSLSEEILQETYIKAIQNIDTFEGKSELKTWITAIAKNLIYQHIRNQKKDIRNLEELRSRENEKWNGKIIEGQESSAYIEQIKDGCLLAMIMCLPFSQRCAFILYVLNDIPIKAIEEVLGKDENAIRILISRAKKTIKNYLCNNCEYLSENSKCRCINMANFSLRNNLLRNTINKSNITSAKQELRKFRDEIELLKTISDEEITKLVADPRFNTIFSIKKVKGFNSKTI